jgi:hypothetical protein
MGRWQHSRAQNAKVGSASTAQYFASTAAPLLQLAEEAAACARVGVIRTKQLFAPEKLVKREPGTIAEMLS